MPREYSPWKNSLQLSFEQRMQLSRFFQAFNTGKGERECCKLAFGNEDKWRKNIWDIFEAGQKLGLIDIKTPVEDRLADDIRTLFRLNSVSVVAVDTTSTEGMRLFGIHCANILLQRLRGLLADHDLHIALGGGDTVQLMVEGLKDAVRNSDTLIKAIQRRLHVWTATVGHQRAKWDKAALTNVFNCGLALKLPVARCRVLSGPPSFTVEEFNAYCHREDIVQAIDEAAHNMRVVVTSCGAGDNNYCLEMMEQLLQKRGAKLPKAAGEVLFSLYDDEGQVISLDVPLFTLFPRDRLVERIASSHKEGEPFMSLGLVYGSSQSTTEAKVRALRAAIAHPERAWFTDVVCTEVIARDLLQGGSGASGQL